MDITIDGKKIQIIANAMTPILFRKLFNQDLIDVLQGDVVNMSAQDQTLFFLKFAFLLHSQATKTFDELMKISIDEFYEFMKPYGHAAWYGNWPEQIMEYWNSTLRSDSDEKNQASPQ